MSDQLGPRENILEILAEIDKEREEFLEKLLDLSRRELTLRLVLYAGKDPETRVSVSISESTFEAKDDHFLEIPTVEAVLQDQAFKGIRTLVDDLESFQKGENDG